MNTLGMCLNIENNAPTQYSNFAFTGLCLFNGTVLASGSSGIFTLDGVTDNGTNISSWFKTAAVSFSFNKSVKLRQIILAGYLSGKLQVDVYYDEVLEGTYYVDPLSSGGYRTVYVNINSDTCGEFVSIKVTNLSGSDFSVDRIDVVPIEVVSNITGYVIGRTKVDIPDVTVSASGS